MRINSRVFLERSDMLGDIQIPNCNPKELREVAEKIMNMVIELDYSVGDYNSISELDKKITTDFWRRYDNLGIVGDINIVGLSNVSFKQWYLKATEASIIERALRWLISHNYLIIKDAVRERAMKASEKFSNAIRGK